MARIRIRALDGSETVADVPYSDPQPPDELAALRAEIATLKAAAVTIAQRSTPMTKTQAEALVSVTVVKA